MKNPKIAVLGLWHLGEIYSACLAELGCAVTGISDDARLIANFNQNLPPLAEPGLVELIAKNRAEGRLEYTTDFAAIAQHEVVWITFDTPVDDEDEVDTAVVIEAIRQAIPHLQAGVTVAISSQLPVGTSSEVIGMIRAARPELEFHYFYSPENLRLGDAVRGFLSPGRIVIGADSAAAAAKAREIFANMPAELVFTSTATAEMTKHAMNAWLATTISFTNDIADVCERVGADVEDVIKALKSEPRVGAKAFLFAGLGFSGGTLGRDLKALMRKARQERLQLPIIEGAYRKNTSRNDIVLPRIEQELGELRGKTIAMLGVTYKAGTPTLRRSQPLFIDSLLRGAGAITRLSDPLAAPEEVAAASPSLFFRDPYQAAEGAEIALIMTPTRDYRELDFARLARPMKNAVLFDTCNILVPVENRIRESGMRYLRIGV